MLGFLRSLLLAISCGTLLAIPVASRAEVPPVDPARDIIVGQPGAPNTLLVYISPGCSPCLNLQRKVTRQLGLNHLASGELRFVFRLLPQYVSTKLGAPPDETETARAQALSRIIATTLRCSSESNGSNIFYRDLSVLASFYEDSATALDQPDFQWPYADFDTSRQILVLYQERARLDPEMYQVCTADGGDERIWQIFEQDLQDFAAAGYKNLPAVFLNGEPLALSGNYEATIKEVAARIAKPKSPEDAEFEACRQREASIRLNVPERDVASLIAGINNRAARPRGYQGRGGRFWQRVAAVWREAAWACGRYE